MVVVARTTGGPGAGKTTRALEIMERCLERGVDPYRLGFVSFTRSARREASTRAAEKFGLKAGSLEKEGFFRTLHSVCHQALAVKEGELLTGTAEDNEWFQAITGDEEARLSRSNNDDYLVTRPHRSLASRALALWDASRNRLVPLKDVQTRAAYFDDDTPGLSDCQDILFNYEQAKKKDGRLDFTDLLCRFVGYRWSGGNDFSLVACPCQVSIPILPVWIHDEAQDMSALTAQVFRRLIEESEWAYLMGDHLQAVYGWAGSDGSIFADWPVAKDEELPISYRCRQGILDYSWQVIRDDPRAHRRKSFRSEVEGGEIDRASIEQALGSIKPGESTLVLTRTNDYVKEMSELLDDLLIPWKPIKGGGGYAAPARVAGVAALVSLAQGNKIDGEAIWRILQLLPSRANGMTLFDRGTKSWFEERENRAGLLPCSLKEMVSEVGATPAFANLVSEGGYIDLLEPAAARMAQAAQVHGPEAIGSPACQVGTIHSAKGMESDHVILLNRIPYPTQLAIEEESGLAEERRLWYVGATRPRYRLTIAEGGDGEPFPGL